tara:strand:- start:68 stop:520 length:453 start_codon:yes stop_codon:yes gene_type:complete
LIKLNNEVFNLKELEVFGNKFALELDKGDLILLSGDLGSGKTTFVRFVIQSLYKKNKIKIPKQIRSPSYPILITYPLLYYEIFHYDLYRIKKINELIELDIYENLQNSITFIEWPNIILENLSNQNYYKIDFEIKNQNTRYLNLKLFNKN